MDLGFGGFLEKFETHFGIWPTRALLLLIGLAVAALAGSIIWNYLLLPFAEMIPDPRSGPAYQFAKLILVLALFLLLMNQLFRTVDNWARRKLIRQTKERLEEAKKILGEAEQHHREAREFHDEAKADVEEAGNIVAAAELAINKIFEYALKNDMLVQSEIDELRALIEG